MKTVVTLIVLLLFCTLAHAQGNKILFLDAQRGKPLSNVKIVHPNGEVIASSDITGTAVIPIDIYARQSRYIAICLDHRPDTFYKGEDIIRLSPLSVLLEEAVVNSRSAKRILHSSQEYVVDYEFVDEYILVASYSGSFGKKQAKVFLLDQAGDTLALTYINEEPVALFKSCMNRCYLVTADRFYSMDVYPGSIRFEDAYDLALLEGMKQCQLMLDSTQYYKFAVPDLFQVEYARLAMGDTLPQTFYTVQDNSAYKSYMEELREYMNSMHQWEYNLAAQQWRTMGILNRLSQRYVNVPLYSKNDTLLIFDYNNRTIWYFNKTGQSLGNNPIYFYPDKLMRMEVIKDAVTNLFYIYSYAEKQRLHRINLDEPGSIATISIEKPFAENVKVYNGDIYYLWQDSRNVATRQLYVQKGFY